MSNDDFEKGGPGSGKKGHTGQATPKIFTEKIRGMEQNVTMHQKNVRPGHHLVAIHNRGEGDHGDIHEVPHRHGFNYEDVEKGGVGSGSKGHKTSKIVKQPWDESVKDTPEYDVRRAQRKEDGIKSQLEKLKAEYKAKFGVDYDSAKKSYEPPQPIYKSEKPYTEDLNDMVESQELEKGRGPDLQQRKQRGKDPLFSGGGVPTKTEVARNRRLKFREYKEAQKKS